MDPDKDKNVPDVPVEPDKPEGGTTPPADNQPTTPPATPDGVITKEQYEKDMKEMRDYVNTSQNLLSAVYGDEDIQNLIKKKYSAPETPGTPSTPETPKQDPKITEMDTAMRSQSIMDFDTRYGIKPEEQADVHAKMAKELQDLGQDIRYIPLDSLPTTLEKVFRLSHADRYDQISKSKGATEAMANMSSQFPTQGGGSSPSSDGSVPLNDSQKDWLGKMGFTPEKATEVLKKSPSRSN